MNEKMYQLVFANDYEGLSSAIVVSKSVNKLKKHLTETIIPQLPPVMQDEWIGCKWEQKPDRVWVYRGLIYNEYYAIIRLKVI